MKQFYKAIKVQCIVGLLVLLLFCGDSVEQGNQSITIQSSFPPLSGSQLPLMPGTFNITYSAPVALSDGNITIYEQLPSESIISYLLRQQVPGVSQYCKLSDDKETVQITVLNSTLSSPNSQYFIEVAPDFATSASGNGTVQGVEKGNWNFTTGTEMCDGCTYPHDTGPGKHVTAVVRLNNPGTDYFKKLPNRQSFIDDLLKQLSESAPLRDGTLQTKYVAQEDKSITIPPILIAINIKKASGNDTTSASWIVQLLNNMILNKWVGPLALDNTTVFLDETYGCRARSSPDYRKIFSVAGAAIAISAFVAIILECCTEKASPYVAVLSFILIADFVSDAFFLAMYGKVVPYIYKPGVICMVVPIVFNWIAASLIIRSEISRKDGDFMKYWEANAGAVSFWSFLSGIDLLILGVLESRIGRKEAYRTKFSRVGWRWIIFASLIKFLGQNCVQWYLQLVYTQQAIIYDVIPFITYVMCSLSIIFPIFMVYKVLSG